MSLRRLVWLLLPLGYVVQATLSHAQSRDGGACTPPVLSRLIRHRIVPGETIASLAQRYDLIPATLMGMNPSLRGGQAPVGSEILIPPYNGIRVEVPAQQSWRDIAKRYGVRPDVLFEVNGCQPAPRVVFVPGVNWSPNATPSNPVKQVLAGLPIANGKQILAYGWVVQPTIGKVAFHSGIDLAAPVGTPVSAIGEGTVAFAGTQGNYGAMVVVNHAEGLQTRYGQLASLPVKVGQSVRRGQVIGTVGTSGKPSSVEPHLHFEVRSRSKLGWVAENPANYLPNTVSDRAGR